MEASVHVKEMISMKRGHRVGCNSPSQVEVAANKEVLVVASASLAVLLCERVRRSVEAVSDLIESLLTHLDSATFLFRFQFTAKRLQSGLSPPR